MTNHTDTIPAMHEVIPAALADYCEAVRQSRLAIALRRGCAKKFAEVVIADCKPKQPARPVGESLRLDDVKAAHVLKVVAMCGGSHHKAAKLLGTGVSTVYDYTKAAKEQEAQRV